MDLTGLTAFLTALGVFLAALLKVWLELRSVRGDYRHVWAGILKRGFVEAVYTGHLKRKVNGKVSWVVSEDACEVYLEILPELKALLADLEGKLGRPPGDEELGWAIERKLQTWMAEHACPVLGVNQHGCIAIACVLAREQGP